MDVSNINISQRRKSYKQHPTNSKRTFPHLANVFLAVRCCFFATDFSSLLKPGFAAIPVLTKAHFSNRRKLSVEKRKLDCVAVSHEMPERICSSLLGRALIILKAIHANQGKVKPYATFDSQFQTNIFSNDDCGLTDSFEYKHFPLPNVPTHLEKG